MFSTDIWFKFSRILPFTYGEKNIFGDFPIFCLGENSESGGD